MLIFIVTVDCVTPSCMKFSVIVLHTSAIVAMDIKIVIKIIYRIIHVKS